jgi:hypothetical protein
METDNLVTVLTRTYPYELAVVRGRIESEGIYCFVKDELTLQVFPYWSVMLGGAKLQVRESDLQEVADILSETGYPTRLNDYKIMLSDGIRCPYCGSEDISEFRTTFWPFAGWLFILGSMLLLAYGSFGPAPFPGKACHCFECGCDSKIKH